jgi:rubrerythrin
MWQFNEAEYRKWLQGARGRFDAGARPDLFERYALPLGASDEDDIKRALETLKSFWGKNAVNPKLGTLLRVLGAEHKEAAEKLLDPARRRLERFIAEEERTKREATRLETLRATVGVVTGKGHVTPREVAELVAVYSKKGFTEADVRAVIGAVPVREGADAPAASRHLDEGLPGHIRDHIRTHLAVLGLPDLYAFLRIKPESAKEQWSAAYERQEREWRPKRPDERRTAANVLLGVVKAHLVEHPERYRQARIWEAAETMRAGVSLAALDKRITRSEYETLMRNARAAGLSDADAADVILTLASELDAVVETSAPAAAITCPVCQYQASLKDAPDLCPSCRHPLWMRCPKCNEKIAASAPSCGICHLNLSNLRKAGVLKAKADLAIKQGRIEEARGSVEEAEALLDGADAELDELNRRIKEVEDEIKKLCGEARAQLSAHLLVAACATLERLAKLAPACEVTDGRPAREMLVDAAAKLREARAAVARACKHQRDGRLAEAVREFAQASSAAEDLEEARKGLDACPPEPPPKVAARTAGDGIEISWQPSPAAGRLTYLVVRQEGHAPGSPGEGTQVAETEGLVCRDSEAPEGVLLFYSVFVRRGGALSPPCASAGLLHAAEIRDLQLVPGDRAVKAIWKPVAPGAQARARRRIGAPLAHATDGDEIRCGPSGFNDQPLENGRTCHYRILVEYPNPEGGRIYSQPRLAQATPEAPLAAVDDLRFALVDGGLEISWRAPGRGEVRIYRAAQRPGHESGARVELPVPPSLGQIVRAKSGTSAFDPAPVRLAHYVAVTVFGQTGILGKPRRHGSEQDVADLTAEDQDTRLVLRWKWPPDCVLARILWRADRHADDPEETADGKREVARAGRESHGELVIENPANSPYRITVFAGYTLDGQTVFSPGAHGGCRTELRSEPAHYELGYRFEKVRGLFHAGHLKVHLKALNRDIVGLPELVVVARNGETPPRGPGDGQVQLKLGGERGSGPSLLKGRESTYEFELTQSRSTLAVLFRDPKAYRRFRLSHPPAAEAYFK